MENSIKPDKRLLTKSWMILLTISLLIALTALLLQVLIPLDENLNGEEVSRILWPLTVASILLLWIISVPIIILWIKNLEYMIKDERVTIHKGILSKVHKNIPYRAITDFILHRSLYDRALGIASIRIQTAGQSQTATGFEGHMAGLADWNELHKTLRQKLKTLHPMAESLTTRESSPALRDGRILEEILTELKAIRKALEK